MYMQIGPQRIRCCMQSMISPQIIIIFDTKNRRKNSFASAFMIIYFFRASNLTRKRIKIFMSVYIITYLYYHYASRTPQTRTKLYLPNYILITRNFTISTMFKNVALYLLQLSSGSKLKIVSAETGPKFCVNCCCTFSYLYVFIYNGCVQV